MLASPKGGVQFVVPDGEGTLAEVNFKFILCIRTVYLYILFALNEYQRTIQDAAKDEASKFYA